jgi:hypothetical protein
MSPRRITLFVAAAAPLLLALLGTRTPALAQTPAETAEARELFVQGSNLAEKGKWDEARVRFERSLKLKHASLTLYSLGVAQRQTGRLVEARASFVAFLEEPSTPSTKPFEKPAREAVAELDKRIARVRFDINPAGVPGMTVELDGVVVPPETITEPRPVNPGAHSVTVSAPGYKMASARMSASEGEQVVARLALNRVVPVDPTAPVVSGGSVMDHVVPVVLIGSGFATFAAGLAVGMAGVIEASSAPTRDGPEADGARSKALVGDIIGGVGLATAGTGIALILLSAATGPKSTAGARPVTLWVEPTRAGGAAGVRVRF